jgi:hypothetical protein
MTLVTAQMSVSVDGFYAGPKDDTDPQRWMDGPEAAGFFRVTRWVIDAEAWRQRLGFEGGERNTNSDIIAETYEAAGAYVIGGWPTAVKSRGARRRRSALRCSSSRIVRGPRCSGSAAQPLLT